MQKKYASLIVAAGFAASLAVVLPAFAQTRMGGPNGLGGRFGMGMGMRGGPAMPPGIFGTVDTISGDTFQITSKMIRPNASSTSATVYTVDATNATVIKNGATSTIASVAVGDTVMVRGTVNGINVTATVIRDGMMGIVGRPGMFASSTRGEQGNGGKGLGRGPTSTATTSPIQGNGEPVIAGSVASMSGSSLTITNASNVTYTVDASNAAIVKGRATSTIASIAVGDNVVVQGVVNGTAITASSIIDQGAGHQGGAQPNAPATGFHLNVFSSIGNFFKHMFGF